MRNLRVSNRYAKALLMLAQEDNFTEQAYNDMKLVFEVFRQNRELKNILNNPVVRITKKINIITAIFENKIHPISLHYLTLITRKRRAKLIEGIAWEFQKVYREALNMEVVTFITAGEVDEFTREKATKVARQLTGKTIVFERKIEPEIIGGFKLRIGDYLYDAGVAGQLEKMRKHLLKSS